MGKKIRILYVEDVPADAELILYELSRNGMDFSHTIVESKKDYIEALIAIVPDLILSDYYLPQFDGMNALSLRNEIAPQTPFIIVTGTLNNEVVIECMKAGADDCIHKTDLTKLYLSIKSAFAGREEKLIRLHADATVGKEDNLLKKAKKPVYKKYSDDFRRGGRDIKEYELIEEKLTILDMAMMSAGIGTLVFDLVGNKRYFDRKACQLLGFPPDQYKRTEEEFLNCIHPEERQEVKILLSFTIREKTDLETDFRVVWNDGTIRFLTARVKTVVDSKGEPVRLIGLLWDITYHRLLQITHQESIRKTNSIINNLNGAVFRCKNDREMTMEFISEGIKELSGYPSWDFLMNRARSFASLIYSEDKERVIRSIDEALREKKPFTVEFRIVADNGDLKWIWERGRGVFAGDKIIAMEGYLSDITDKKRTEQELEGSLEQLHLLTQYIEKVREEERVSISRELHDDLGQALTAVKIDLGTIRQQVSDTSVIPRINKVFDLVSDTIKTVQKLTAQLRPQIIDDLGLESAIEWYTSEFTQRNKIEVMLDIKPGETISPDASLIVFRIMQEALTNIVRHSGATQVKIALIRDEETVNFRVSDNGAGIQENELKSKKSFGIISMRERAASIGGIFEINRGENKGTVINLIFPFNYSKPQ